MYFKFFYIIKRFFNRLFRLTNKLMYFTKNALKIIILAFIVYMLFLRFNGGF